MDITELIEQINAIDKMKYMMTFEDLVDKAKDTCNNFAVKSHCQSTFLIDKENDFLAEIYSKEVSVFVVINRRYNKNIIIFYAIEK